MRWVGLSFILLLAFASLSMIMITIRLAIFSRRNEIAIMKLVGASNWFVRIPFILEGMIEGFLGSTITIVIIYIVRTTAFEKISDMLGFIPGVLDVSLVDDVIEVTDEDAIETTRQLSMDYGLLVGISAGANVWAARQLTKKIDGNIATILPDRAERYFSTALL